MKRVRLEDGTRAWCLRRFEALALDAHVSGYLAHGIEVRPGDVVFDVGANIGLFGLRLLSDLDGQATVLAFEPIPEIHAVLARNLAPFAAHALPFGLSCDPGHLALTYYPRGPALSTAHPALLTDAPAQLVEAVRGGARHAPRSMRWGSLLPDPVLRLIAKRLVGKPKTVRCEMRTVTSVMEEHALDRIDLLKVDVEGAELDVLRGVSEETWPRIRQVVAEVHDVERRLDTVTSLLARHGFSHVVTEQEPGLRGTWLHNVFARR